MDFEKACIVESVAGHDKGRVFIVLDVEEDFLTLADGKLRKVENPKRKRKKHTRLLTNVTSPIVEKIINGEKVLNSEIRKTLSQFAVQTVSEDQA